MKKLEDDLKAFGDSEILRFEEIGAGIIAQVDEVGQKNHDEFINSVGTQQTYTSTFIDDLVEKWDEWINTKTKKTGYFVLIN